MEEIIGILRINPEGNGVELLERLNSKIAVQCDWPFTGMEDLEKLLGGKIKEYPSEYEGIYYYRISPLDPNYHEHYHKMFILKKKVAPITSQEFEEIKKRQS